MEPIRYDNVPKFTITVRGTPAKCVKVYDGDTAHFVFAPFENGQQYRFVCRMKGYNSAELKCGDDLVQKKQAIAARDELRSLILNKDVTIDTYGFDKYGRVLVDVFLRENGINVNEYMVTNDFGKKYDGTGHKSY